ncbi:hypothetical protein M3Y97_01053400 [Aphelenchoides bicaudatus]|nr:hypothetical protein M3Y97_01053400 [Aphelenchoides bicaudatus]
MATASESDDESTTSATPLQQCVFWGLTIAFMIKLGCFVVVAVIIHNNDWIHLKAVKDFDFVYIRGISFDDCAYEVNATETITCIKWSLVNQTEWYAFWNYYKIDSNTVTLPSAWYANAYYICLLLLVWYVLDMSSMLVMCCKQRKNVENFEYHKQVSILSAIFIIITYISVHIGLAHGRQTKFIDFRMKANQTSWNWCQNIHRELLFLRPGMRNPARPRRLQLSKIPKKTQVDSTMRKCCRPNTEIEEQAPGPSRSPKPGPSRSPIAGPSTRQKVEIEMRPLKEM